MSMSLAPIAFICPAGFLILALFTNELRRSPVLGAVSAGICFAAFFYGVRLDELNDIARHMNLLAVYDGVDIWHCFGAGHYDYLFVWDMWCWLIAKCGDPYLLQASSCFIAYSIIVYIIIDFANMVKADWGVTVFALFTAIASIPFLGIISGVRSSTALLISALAVYRYYLHDASIAQLFCLLLCATMIHSVAMLIAVAFFANIFVRKVGVVGLIALFFLVLGLSTILSFCLPLLKGFSNPLVDFVVKAGESFLGYSQGDDWSAAHSASLNTRVNYLFNYLWMGALALNAIPLSQRQISDAEANLVSILLVTIAMTLGLSLVLETNGTRLVPFIFSFGALIIVKRKTLKEIKRNKNYFYLDCVSLVVCLGLLALHVYSIIYGLVSIDLFVSSMCFGFLVKAFEYIFGIS